MTKIHEAKTLRLDKQVLLNLTSYYAMHSLESSDSCVK